MRKPDLAFGVFVQGQQFTTRQLILELMGRDWSQDEASVAAFDRIKAAFYKPEFILEEKDFTRLCDLIRPVQFPAASALELGELRNRFVLTPKQDDDPGP